MGFILIDVAAASLVPYFSKQVVDTLSLNLISSVSITVLLLGFFWMVEKTIVHIQEILFFPVINNTIRDLSFAAVQHIHSLSLSDYHKLSIPETLNCIRWRISISARSFIRVLFLMMIPSSIKLLLALIVATHMGMFGIVLLPTFILALVVLYKGTKWYVTAREEAWHIADKVTLRMHDSILNSKITRFFQDFEMQQIDKILAAEAAIWNKHNIRLHSIHIMIGTLFGLATTFILFSAIRAIQNHTLTVGDFVLLKGQLIAAFLPLKLLSVEFRQLAESLIDIKKIIRLFDTPIEVFTTNKDKNPRHFNALETPVIQVKNLSFSYHPEIPLFENLSLQIEHGEKLVIMGKNGSGKSSLIHLLAALQQPTAGSIEFVHHKSLIHCIPQDFRLFNISLRDNITYGMKSVSDNILINIAKKVGLMDLVASLPLGFDTIVGEMGVNLSGGEKQKIALVRAILIEPPILLLDETTNSLSIDQEQAILKTIFSLIPTVIVATHRVSTLPLVDRILKIQSRNLVSVDIQKTLRESEAYA